MFVIELHKLQNENENAHLWRLARAKDDGLLDKSWDEIADVLNADWHEGDERTTKTYMNRYSAVKIFYEDGVFSNSTSLLSDITAEKQEIKKEKQKLFDERRDLNAKLRSQARYEEDMKNLSNALLEICEKRYEPFKCNILNGDKSMIVLLSDLHIGGNWYSLSGMYDTSIAKETLEKYYNKIVNIGKNNNVKKCYVVCLGDMISGNIHKNLQITNREHVVNQIKIACEYIGDFVYSLSKDFEIEFHSVSGNHSRLEKKEDALTDERLDSLVPWFLKNTMDHIDNVEIIEDEVDSTVCILDIGDKTYVGVHGDYDGMGDAQVAKLCMWLGFTPYCIMMGHKHYNAMTEVSGVKVVQSGSLCGTGDNYTREKRLKGNPSQMILLCNKKGCIDAVYPLEFSLYD